MRESATYQLILDEGRVEEARKLLMLVGTDRFGPPDDRGRPALETVGDVDRLEELVQRLLRVSNWDELLTTS